MINILEKSVGSGPLFPIELDNNGGWGIVKGDLSLIENNLISILVFQVGWKLRQEIFGTRVYETLEEPNVPTLRLLVYRFVKDAIASWEPRIVLRENIITFTKTSVDIHIKYEVNTSNLVGELDFSYQKQQ